MRIAAAQGRRAAALAIPEGRGVMQERRGHGEGIVQIGGPSNTGREGNTRQPRARPR